MKRYNLYLSLFLASVLMIAMLTMTSCKNNTVKYDASGVLEATEIIVSAQANGEIKVFSVEEGEAIKANTAVGYIDTTQLYLQKRLLMLGQKATRSQKPDVKKQVAATQAALDLAKREEQRIERLKNEEAATQQQVDNIKSQIKQLQAQLSAQISTLQNNISGIDAESSAQDIEIARIQDLLSKSLIQSSISGTVLQKYVNAGEQTAQGRPLMKVANLEKMTLKAYLTSSQVSKVKLGQKVSVYAFVNDAYKRYDGLISSISNQAEFTPKTIQTQEERINLVYAVKISVRNTDGMLKGGMYADVAL